MGRELLRIGAPFRQPEWSALALLEAPDYVVKAHAGFLAAGADVVTTNSFAVVPFHIGEERFAARGRDLADLAGRLARQAVAESGRPALVAGSLPPPFGSYRPDLFRPAEAARIFDTLVAGLAPHVDLWLAETQSSIAEAEAAKRAISAVPARPFWISFTLEDTHPEEIAAGRVLPALRSGESIAQAVAAVQALGAEALLFNCSHAAVMEPALRAAAEALEGSPTRVRIGAYANAFVQHRHSHERQANSDLCDLRADLDPAAYAEYARRWKERGASIVGGWCGIGPDHIASLAAALRE